MLSEILKNYEELPKQIYSIGGGIIQDISGFIASMIKRGIKWTFIPTTMASQCDSCIGSKISLNLGGIKNQLGLFYSPENIASPLNGYEYHPYVKTDDVFAFLTYID